MPGQQGQQRQQPQKQPSAPPSLPPVVDVVDEGSEGEGLVGQRLDYKPLPIEPELLEVPQVPVDFLERLETPAEQAAWSEDEYDEVPIPILKKETTSEPSAEPQPFVPTPRFRTITVRDGVDGQVTPELPYRRVVTVLTIGDAARVTFAFRSRYEGESMLVVNSGEPPVDLPVFPLQELFVRHNTGVDQEMSFQIEPVGEGRG